MKKLFVICCLLFAVCCLGCNFDTNTTTNDYDDSELRTRISELERILTEKENQESESQVIENSSEDNNVKIISNGDFYYIVDKNNDIQYYFSKVNPYVKGYILNLENELRIFYEEIQGSDRRNCSLKYIKKYGYQYLIADNFCRQYIFCLNHKHTRSTYFGKSITLLQKCICEDPSLEEEYRFAETTYEFLQKVDPTRNQEYLINYILNFIENDE